MHEAEFIEKIKKIKNEHGKELIILTHHYQRKEIVDLGDFRGDSFGLSQKAAADNFARNIVFCGVHFMAESAAILSKPGQTVQIPDRMAGCPMADMAEIGDVQRAWEEVLSIAGQDAVVPLVYMNSNAELKAFAGRRGGTVCTSSNVRAAMKWAFEKGDKIFFFPDQHLGRNTGKQMRISPEDMILWKHNEPLGGNSSKDIKRARLILWDGFCLVHTRFLVEHVYQMKQMLSDAKLVVHPECFPDVVAMADAVGSTSYIVKYVQNAPPKAEIIIGTEINLVHRLALEFPNKTVVPLHRSLCANMFRINPEKLLHTMENLGKRNVVKVPDDLKAGARLALGRMLTLKN